MAKAILTAEIPTPGGSGVMKLNVEGNVATEESIQELIKVFGKQQKTQKNNDKGIRDLNDNASDAAENLDEFSDELVRSKKIHEKAINGALNLTRATHASAEGLKQFADSGGSLESIVRNVGDTAVKFASGLGGSIPFVSAIAPGLKDLSGAAAEAVVGLTALAVGTIESYIGLNKSIFNAGLQVEGGFAQFGQFAEDASLPINEFANALIQSSDRLRLFGGGAPGGLKKVSEALAKLKTDDVMSNLYSLGFTTEEIVASMTDYGVAARRAGRDLSAPELADESYKYLKNLRELSRLTGVSVKDQQAKMDADRANLFIQNALLDVAPKNRAAAEAFASSIPEALAPIKDFIVTGQSFTNESGIMANEMSVFSGIYRRAYEAVASGALTQEQANTYLSTQLKANADAIDAEAKRTTQIFGVAPDSMIQEGVALGSAIRTVREMVEAGIATSTAGTTNVVPDSMDETLGKFETTLNNVQSEMQSVFFDTANGLSPMLTRMAEGADGAAESVGDFKRMLQDIVNGNFSSFNNMFGTSVANNNSQTMMQNLTDAISAAIFEGFNRVLEQSWLGRQFLPGGESALPENNTHGTGNFISPDYNIPPAATGGILNGPTSGFLSELHGTEAVVPLPDGRSIPVQMTSVESKSMPELVQINKNLLQQNFSLNEKLDRLIRVTEESNNISRNTAYSRA